MSRPQPHKSEVFGKFCVPYYLFAEWVKMRPGHRQKGGASYDAFRGLRQ
jgi:hypothetical protein